MKYFLIFISIVALNGLIFAKKPPKTKTPKPKPGEWIVPTKASVPKIIFGHWIWQETDCCGIRHGYTNPANTNDSISLILNIDNTFLETHTKINALPRNGSVIMFKETEYDLIQFNDERPARYTISDNNDTSKLSWKHLELQAEKYVRKK